MKKRIISLLISVVLVIATLSGCKSQQTASYLAGLNIKTTSQFAVALNPILLFDDSDTVIAFNDIKNAIVNDQKNNTITSLNKNTGWTWAYQKGDDWKLRNVFAVEKWRNGKNVAKSNFTAYTFAEQGSLSVMPFVSQSANIKTYQNDELPKAALALSVSGKEKEALCYKIKQDGIMHIPENTVTALKSVEGINADFLKEGSNRTAVVSYILNDRVLWAGEFSSEAGNLVTNVTCPDMLNVSVKSGDLFFVAIQLNAQLDEQYEEDNTDDEDEEDIPTDDTNNADGEISLMTGYDSTYKIVYPESAGVSQKNVINQLRVDMVKVFDADVLISTDKEAEKEYELLIGKTNRAESQKVYNELNSSRKNNASDFIIRVVNNKLVIAANTDYALSLATKHFMKNYCQTDISKISSKLNYIYRPQMETITIDGENISKYIIRTEKYPSLLTLRAAENLAQYIVSKTGYELSIVKSNTTSTYEILVGMTTSSGISASVFQSSSLDYLKDYDLDEYKIFVSNKKLFIESGSTYAANAAVLKAIEALESNKNLLGNFTLSGKYTKGEYTLSGGYAYTWGDEFLSSSQTLSKKRWNFETKTNVGPWYNIDDPYYLASLKSLSDTDPNNDFGGPWSDKIYDSARQVWCVQEGNVQKGNKLNESYWIKDNALVMRAKKTAEGYSGVSIQTKGLMEFRYGILEARVIMSTNNGAVSTFWTRSRDGGNITNEFDLCENFGEDKISPNMHTWAEGGAYHVDHKKQLQYHNVMYPAANEHFYDTYHYITMEWTPEKVDFYLDGNLYLSQEITTENWKAFAENTYLLFDCTAPSNNYNMWTGSYNPGNFLMEKIGSFCEDMYVDNVRVYQIDSRKYSLRVKK